MTVTLHQSFLSGAECEVVTRLAKRVARTENLNLKHIAVHPVGRLGHSGARVCTVSLGDGSSRIFKLDKVKEIEIEERAARSVRSPFGDALGLLETDVPRPQIAKKESLGGLAYLHAEGYGHHETELPTELEAWITSYDDRTIPTIATARIVRILDRLYDLPFKGARMETSRKKRSLRTLYCKNGRKYLRPPHSSERIVSVLGIGEDSRARLITFLGRRIANPFLALKKLLNTTLPCAVGPVHGDLHFRNIILGEGDNPHLIDFKWAHRRSAILLDYVLPEISLRFMLVPQCYERARELDINRWLLDEHGYLRIPRDAPHTVIGKYHERLAALIKIIRGRAREAAKDGYTFDEYLTSTFLVLFGVLKYKSYDSLLAVHALGLIAKKVVQPSFGE